MSGRRFELLMKYIHLNDSKKQPPRGSDDYDKLYKVRPLLDLVVSAFKNSYTPQQSLSIDESIIGFKGRLCWVLSKGFEACGTVRPNRRGITRHFQEAQLSTGNILKYVIRMTYITT